MAFRWDTRRFRCRATIERETGKHNGEKARKKVAARSSQYLSFKSRDCGEQSSLRVSGCCKEALGVGGPLFRLFEWAGEADIVPNREIGK